MDQFCLRKQGLTFLGCVPDSIPERKVMRTTFVSEYGQYVGRDHHRAKLTDEQVDEIRDLHESGEYGYARLAKKYGVHKSTIRGICRYEERIASPHSQLRIVEITTYDHKRFDDCGNPVKRTRRVRLPKADGSMFD